MEILSYSGSLRDQVWSIKQESDLPGGTQNMNGESETGRTQMSQLQIQCVLHSTQPLRHLP